MTGEESLGMSCLVCKARKYLGLAINLMMNPGLKKVFCVEII